MMNNSLSYRIGVGISALVAAAIAAIGVMNLFLPHIMAGNMVVEGFPLPLAAPIGVMALSCAILYALPRTAALGAILLTAYLGGAICTHFRLNEFGSPPQIISVTLGILAWAGLYLRCPMVRAILPIHQPARARP